MRLAYYGAGLIVPPYRFIADFYDDSSTYAVGDIVWYNTTLYKCTTAITVAEDFTPAHWTYAQIANELGGNVTISFPVTITQSGSSYTCDKTNAEIYAAYQAGEYVYALFPISGMNMIAPLMYADSTSAYFGVYMGSFFAISVYYSASAQYVTVTQNDFATAAQYTALEARVSALEGN